MTDFIKTPVPQKMIIGISFVGSPETINKVPTRSFLKDNPLPCNEMRETSLSKLYARDVIGEKLLRELIPSVDRSILQPGRYLAILLDIVASILNKKRKNDVLENFFKLIREEKDLHLLLHTFRNSS